DFAEAGADEAADGHAGGLEHAAHLAIATLMECDAIPTVAAFPAQMFQCTEPGFPIVELDALDQLLLLFGSQLAQYPYCVFAFGTITWMHEAVGDFAGRGEDQQAFGVEVEAPHGQPLAHLQFGQTAKDIGTPLRIVVADDFAGWLVVEDDARRLLAIGARDDTPVIAHLVVFANTLADVGRLTIDGDAPRNDEFFHFAP